MFAKLFVRLLRFCWILGCVCVCVLQGFVHFAAEGLQGLRV